MKKHLQFQRDNTFQRYRNDSTFALNCRIVTAIAFVPVQRIDKALQTLENRLPDDLVFLLEWMEDYYVG